MPDKELMMLCAIRYALGRRTYITGVVVDYVMREKVFTKKFKHNALMDIADCTDLGDECDKEKWNELQEYLQSKSN